MTINPHWQESEKEIRSEFPDSSTLELLALRQEPGPALRERILTIPKAEQESKNPFPWSFGGRLFNRLAGAAVLAVLIGVLAFWVFSLSSTNQPATTQPGQAAPIPTERPAERPATVEAPAAVSETFTCPVTEPVIDQPPDDPNADPFGEGQYFINENRTIWVGLPWGGWKTGGEKVIWIRPAGTELTISGRLLDQENGPLLEASIPCCYVTGFQVTGIYFPVPGCWEITAEAGPERLQFVTEVGFGSTVIKGLILLDHQLNSETLSPGAALTVTLNWQGGVAAADDMVIFFHLLDAAGSLVAQFDQPLPAETWTAQNITTTHSLVVPSQPGTYSLAVGLYDSATNTRIPFYSKDELAAGGIITLPPPIQVTPIEIGTE